MDALRGFRSPGTSERQGSVLASNGEYHGFVAQVREAAEGNTLLPLVFLYKHTAVSGIADPAHQIVAQHTHTTEHTLLSGEPGQDGHEDHLASKRDFFVAAQLSMLFRKCLCCGSVRSADEIPPQIDPLVSRKRIELRVPERTEDLRTLGIHLRDGERIARKENMRRTTCTQRCFAEGHMFEKRNSLSAEEGSVMVSHIFEPEEVIAHDGSRGALAGRSDTVQNVFFRFR